MTPKRCTHGEALKSSKIRHIKAQIQANAFMLVELGDITKKDGRTIATTITDLFSELREVEACG